MEASVSAFSRPKPEAETQLSNGLSPLSHLSKPTLSTRSQTHSNIQLLSNLSPEKALDGA